ncbi:MAG: efflux RND transporter periplasmic adaptor subunit [Planctomycetota bacterium]
MHPHLTNGSHPTVTDFTRDDSPAPIVREGLPGASPRLPGAPPPPAARPGRKGTIASLCLVAAVLASGFGLSAWKQAATAAADRTLAAKPELEQVIETAISGTREQVPTTTAIGTVRALRSVSLRNELPGTVREVHLQAGDVVEEGALLVALDVDVEQAELRSLRADASLAQTLLGRVQRAHEGNGAAAADLDRARSQLEIALARVERHESLIERKTIRAPFRARVGLADVHPGQFLESGTLLTTLQGVDDAVHVDFALPQHQAEKLPVGSRLAALLTEGEQRLTAEVLALDARVDSATRSIGVRARVEDPQHRLVPGSSVVLRVPLSAPMTAVVLPNSALRRGPAGEYVFVVAPDAADVLRAARRDVVSGPLLGDEVVIAQGLAAGERVAAAGSFKLFDGARVALTDRHDHAAQAAR